MVLLVATGFHIANEALASLERDRLFEVEQGLLPMRWGRLGPGAELDRVWDALGKKCVEVNTKSRHNAVLVDLKLKAGIEFERLGRGGAAVRVLQRDGKHIQPMGSALGNQ